MHKIKNQLQVYSMIAPTLVIAVLGGGVIVGMMSRFYQQRPFAAYKQDLTKLHTSNVQLEPTYVSGRGDPWYCESKPLDPRNPHPYRLVGTLSQLPLVPGTKQLQLFERQLGQYSVYQALDPQTNIRVHFSAQEACSGSELGCRESGAQKDPWDEEAPDTRHLTDGDVVSIPSFSGRFQVSREPSHFFGY